MRSVLWGAKMEFRQLRTVQVLSFLLQDGGNYSPLSCVDCPRVCERIPFWFLAEGGDAGTKSLCHPLLPGCFPCDSEQAAAKIGFKNRLLQVYSSKYTRGRTSSLKWLLNARLAVTMLKSSSADLGEGRFAWALLKFRSGDGSKQSRLCGGFFLGNHLPWWCCLNPQAGFLFWGWRTRIIAGFFLGL